MFTTYDYKNYSIQSDEVEEAKFWTKKQIENNLGKDLFTPNFELEVKLLIKMGLF
jgi:hypothetical protein